MKIVLNDIEMNTGVADTGGALWYVDGLDGWDSPNLRQSTLDPTTKHGTLLTEALLGARAVTLRGVCKAPDEDGFWAAYNRLLGATSGLGVPFDLTVSENVDKRLGVVRGGPVRQAISGLGSFTFEVPLLAPDPLKYATVPTSTEIAADGQAPVVNAGTFVSFPTLTASGRVEVENFTTALTLTTGTQTVPAGTEIDTLRRTIYAGTVNLYEKISPLSVWWGLQPGDNTVRNHGTATVTVTHYDAWV
jgi:hypothetical protein